MAGLPAARERQVRRGLQCLEGPSIPLGWRLSQLARRERPTRQSLPWEFGHPLGSRGTSTTATTSAQVRRVRPGTQTPARPARGAHLCTTSSWCRRGRCSEESVRRGRQARAPRSLIPGGSERAGRGEQGADPAPPPSQARPAEVRAEPPARRRATPGSPAGGRIRHPAREGAHPGARPCARPCSAWEQPCDPCTAAPTQIVRGWG